jgi:hypothetical protein
MTSQEREELKAKVDAVRQRLRGEKVEPPPPLPIQQQVVNAVADACRDVLPDVPVSVQDVYDMTAAAVEKAQNDTLVLGRIVLTNSPNSAPMRLVGVNPDVAAVEAELRRQFKSTRMTDPMNCLCGWHGLRSGAWQDASDGAWRCVQCNGVVREDAAADGKSAQAHPPVEPLASQLAKLSPQTGDVLVFKMPAHSDLVSRNSVNSTLEKMQRELAALGREVVIVIVPDDCELSLLRPVEVDAVAVERLKRGESPLKAVYGTWSAVEAIKSARRP